MPLWQVIGAIIFSFALVTILWLAWSLVVVKLTGKDRQALIDTLYDPSRGFYPKHDRVLDHVSFTHHYNARLFLRDPWKLYPDDLAYAAKGVRYPHR